MCRDGNAAQQQPRFQLLQPLPLGGWGEGGGLAAAGVGEGGAAAEAGGAAGQRSGE